LAIANAYSRNGEYEQAVLSYQASLQEKEFLPTLNNLVRTYRILEESATDQAKSSKIAEKYNDLAHSYRLEAVKYADQALQKSERDVSVSAVHTIIEWSKVNKKIDLEKLAKGEYILTKLPKSKSKFFLLINWARVDSDKAVYWLGKAEEIALSLDDDELKSYVQLELGDLYQRKQNLEIALKYAHSAYSSSRERRSNEVEYRAANLIGNIYLQRGKKELALKSYKDAISAIDDLNKSSSNSNSEEFIKFNREIQPIYRNILSLILDRTEVSQGDLKTALFISDKLRLSQLKIYFGEDCFEVANEYSFPTKGIATINSVILPDQVFFLLRLPNGQIVKSSRKISQSSLNDAVINWREELKTGFSWRFRDRSKFFYDLVIRPFDSDLKSANSQIKALVFVHDGILRNIPMAALLNGDEYLIEKYSISSSLGLKIRLKQQQKPKLKALIFGLSEPPGINWGELSAVKDEVVEIGNLIESSEFLDSDFTVNNLAQKLQENSYSILHLATHGYFGGSAKDSFILAYDQEISIPKFEQILKESKLVPDLLVLSACETAVGDELSVLGLAGIAAKSGVNSTLGSLWQVEDTNQQQVMRDFYSNLNDNLSNQEESLRQMQIKQIRELAHPYKWAALNLTSNY
jgi:CHAT domain-containing protein